MKKSKASQQAVQPTVTERKEQPAPKKRLTYGEKLLDQRWQKKRLELLQAADWKCQHPYCTRDQDGERPTLHIHHKVYLRGKSPWEYDAWAYAVLCDECHTAAQEQMEQCHIFLAKFRSLRGLIISISKLPEEMQEQYYAAQQNALIGTWTNGFSEGIKKEE